MRKLTGAAGPEGERPALNTTIMLFLVQDGITNGAIYALLGLALVLVGIAGWFVPMAWRLPAIGLAAAAILWASAVALTLRGRRQLSQR